MKKLGLWFKSNCQKHVTVVGSKWSSIFLQESRHRARRSNVDTRLNRDGKLPCQAATKNEVPQKILKIHWVTLNLSSCQGPVRKITVTLYRKSFLVKCSTSSHCFFAVPLPSVSGPEFKNCTWRVWVPICFFCGFHFFHVTFSLWIPMNCVFFLSSHL